MDDTKKLHEKLTRLYCQTLNLFLQMEVLNGLLQVENDERHYYIRSHWGEFFIGIKNALVTAIIVGFAKIFSDPSKRVVSLKRIRDELSEHNKLNSRDKVLTLSAHSDLDVWFETHNTTVGKIKIIRDIEAAHNNGQDAKHVDKVFWAEAEESIKQLRDLLLSMINSLKRKDLPMAESSYGSDARIQTTKIFELLMQSHKQQYELAMNAAYAPDAQIQPVLTDT